ncbi:MAG: nicotinate phosphoribosyltransferase [bacterium]|nr:nicotinate phosphoribosyltransferase [bacterium]
MKDEPIIQSLLDLDLYKLTMAQMVFDQHFGMFVKYAFKNRTKKVRLAEHVDVGELREQLDHVRDLRFSRKELRYLQSIRVDGKQIFFDPEFFGFLEELKLPPYELNMVDGDFQITVYALWPLGIFWETIILSVVNELYYKSLFGRLSLFRVMVEGQRRLTEKMKILEENPDIRFSEFGTRRRFSRSWQKSVVETLALILPAGQLLGTSNVKLAMDYGQQPIGTMAHELFMVYQSLNNRSDEEIRNSHNKVLRDWYNFYGWPLSIALTDTCGSDFFFRDMTEGQARQWKGLRQDSGDPIAFGEKAIKFYESHGIGPHEKLLVFSDGLDIGMILKIYNHFKDRIKVSFGWGTNLTNDLGPGSLSLVVKSVEANGHGLVKLSDNLAKATGKPEDVERFKRIFGYEGENYQECKY